MNTFLLYLLLLQATATSFSGLTSVPLVRNDLVVRRAVLTDEQLNSALAIGQTTPGPIGLYVVIVGYFVDGIPGAIAGMLALATPALLAIPVLGALRVGRADLVAGAARGIVIAASVLTLWTAAGLAGSAVTNLTLAMVGIAALGLLAAARIAPLWIVLLTGAVGLLAL
jgi:chromate transporter